MTPLANIFGTRGETARDQVQAILQAIRRHLAMDVGFVSEFVSGDRVFRFTDGDNLKNPIVVGSSDPLEQSFCFYVARGLMPGLMHDAREDPIAAEMAVTRDLPVGAHLSVPLRHADGTPFGTLCCFSFTPDRSLTTRDLGLLRMCADVIGAVLQRDRQADQNRLASVARVSELIEAQAVEMHFQPICRVADGHLTGFEALARFARSPERSPEVWLAEADKFGLGEELELLTIGKVLAGCDSLDRSLSVSVNVSPNRIVSPRFALALADVPLERVVLELTEHAVVASYGEMRAALAPLRQRGLQLAIDDVGAGHSTMRHVLDLSPEFIKLDRSLIRGIETDSARRALTEALTNYSRRMGCEVVAEGVENVAELAMLREIGVTRAQGYLLGRPMPIVQAAGLPLGTSPASFPFDA